jgi:hypothetical protein
MGTNQLLGWARYLASMGWHIFPITPNAKKPPMVRDWENRATTDLTRIDRCWSAGSFNIGLACGPSRLVVVDLDVDPDRGPDGATGLAELITARGALPLGDTYTVTTPRGGRHLYFTAPPGVHLRSTQDVLAPNIDTRAGGGHVVAPGSVTALGGYELLDDTPPVELPAWLVQACLERPASGAAGATVAPIRGNPTRYGLAALRGECGRVAEAGTKEHNKVLSNAAFRVGLQVGRGNLDHATARAELLGSGQHMVTAGCDCTAREVERVIDAGLAAGIRNACKDDTTNRKEIA